MVDYNTIRFEFPLDDLRQHFGVFSHYRRFLEPTPDAEVAEILEPGVPFLGMIMNLSSHTHRYWIGEVSGTLPKNHYNFFFIPPNASRWKLEPGMNSVFCVQCDMRFLRQFVGDVSTLGRFLSDAAISKPSLLTRVHLALPAEILDSIIQMMREHQFRGKSRELYLRVKSAGMLAVGLMNSHRCYSVAAAEVEAVELQKLYQYMVVNLQYIVDTRPLMNIIDMPEEILKEKFKERFGRSMIEALRYERLKKAEELLLHTTTPIGAVAVKVGYSGATPFLYAFKMQYGVYPKEFRRRWAGVRGE